MEGYVGVLYVEAGALPGWSNGAPLEQATLADGVVRLRWQGRESRVAWREILDRAGLRRLPAPRLAFVSGQGELGLLFQSQSPHEGLTFREPHTCIRSLGRLTPSGLKSEV